MNSGGDGDAMNTVLYEGCAWVDSQRIKIIPICGVKRVLKKRDLCVFKPGRRTDEKVGNC